MKLNKNWHKFLPLFISVIFFTCVTSLSDAQTFNPTLHMDYKNNLLTITAQKADLKNVLLELSDKTGIYVGYPSSLNKQVTTELSRVPLGEALTEILKGTNHVIVYSGSGKNQAAVSKVFVYGKSESSGISGPSMPRSGPSMPRSDVSMPQEDLIAGRIRSYEHRIKLLNQKLSGMDKNSRMGKKYLKQKRSYEEIIENLKNRIR